MGACMRWVLAVFAGLCSITAAAAPPLPPVLEPYVRDGRFDPGDYGWMRGRFTDAAPADRKASAEIEKWLDACRRNEETATRAKLAALGIADAKLEGIDLSDPLCGAVMHAPYPLEAKTFAEFQHALAAAKPVADTYLMAVAQAERIGGPRGPTLSDALLARPLGEQMLRFATNWGNGEMKDAPALSPDARAIVVARIGIALQDRDHKNTQWLKGVVAKEGWPKISTVGERASQEAWLLVQHADADPAFQLEVLRLMEPLAAAGEVRKQNFAYLYDRVMLKIAGKQRYATQAMCKDGKRVPQPLENEAKVQQLRADAGLDPLPTYFAQMTKVFGDCGPDPAKREPARPRG